MYSNEYVYMIGIQMYTLNRNESISKELHVLQQGYKNEQ